MVPFMFGINNDLEMNMMVGWRRRRPATRSRSVPTAASRRGLEFFEGGFRIKLDMGLRRRGGRRFVMPFMFGIRNDFEMNMMLRRRRRSPTARSRTFFRRRFRIKLDMRFRGRRRRRFVVPFMFGVHNDLKMNMIIGGRGGCPAAGTRSVSGSLHFQFVWGRFRIKFDTGCRRRRCRRLFTTLMLGIGYFWKMNMSQRWWRWRSFFERSFVGFNRFDNLGRNRYFPANSRGCQLFIVCIHHFDKSEGLACFNQRII